MSLPGKAEKSYLEVVESGRGCSITGRAQHIDELLPLFEQHGIRCRKEPNGRTGQETLRFEAGADVEMVKEILESYEQAKGS